jgi:hypothetical protein
MPISTCAIPAKNRIEPTRRNHMSQQKLEPPRWCPLAKTVHNKQKRERGQVGMLAYSQKAMTIQIKTVPKMKKNLRMNME